MMRQKNMGGLTDYLCNIGWGKKTPHPKKIKDIYIMIIIAFSKKTSKILPRILCRKWRHVAPIVMENNKLMLYQFIRKNRVEKIPLKMRDIKILMQYGWVFYTIKSEPNKKPNFNNAWTCVQMTKDIAKIKNIWIQTPNALLEKIPKLGIF